MGAYFVLLFYYLVMKRRYALLAGASAAFAYLSHPFTVFYTVPGFLFLIVQQKGAAGIGRYTLGLLSSAVAITIPWFVYASAVSTSLSPFYLYPFATSPEQMLNNPSSVIPQFLQRPVWLTLWIRLVNALRTLTPFPLMFSPSEYPQIPDPVGKLVPSLSFAVLTTYLHTLPGALAAAFSVPAYTVLTKRLLEPTKKALLLGALPLALSVSYFGYLTGGVADLVAMPLVPIIVALAVEHLNGRRILAGLAVVLLLENLGFLWVFLYPAQLIFGLGEMQFVIAVALIFALYVLILLRLRIYLSYPP